MASRSSTSTTNPVVPSSITDRTPGTSVATTGSPDSPRLDEHAGHALALGPAGEHHQVGIAPAVRRRRSGSRAARRRPRRAGSGDPRHAARRRRSGCARNSRPRRPQGGDHLDEAVGPLALGQRPDEGDHRAAVAPVGAAGWNTSGSRPLGVMVTLPAGTPSSSVHSVGHLVALGGHGVDPSQQAAPQPSWAAVPGRGAVGADGVVGERAAPPGHGRHQVLEGLAPVGHHDTGSRRPQGRAQPGDDARVVARRRGRRRRRSRGSGRCRPRAGPSNRQSTPVGPHARVRRAGRPGPGPRAGRPGPAGSG